MRKSCYSISYITWKWLSQYYIKSITSLSNFFFFFSLKRHKKKYNNKTVLEAWRIRSRLHFDFKWFNWLASVYSRCDLKENIFFLCSYKILKASSLLLFNNVFVLHLMPQTSRVQITLKPADYISCQLIK